MKSNFKFMSSESVTNNLGWIALQNNLHYQRTCYYSFVTLYRLFLGFSTSIVNSVTQCIVESCYLHHHSIAIHRDQHRRELTVCTKALSNRVN